MPTEEELNNARQFLRPQNDQEQPVSDNRNPIPLPARIREVTLSQAIETRRAELPPTITEYKGKPMLVLNPHDRFPFQFQMAKAILLVQHFETIKKFVESNGRSIE